MYVCIYIYIYIYIYSSRNEYKILVRKPERKRPLGGPRHRREDIIMDPREVGWEAVDWIDLAEGRDQWRAVMKTVMTHKNRGIS
jgi:hypothetical protein